MTTLWFDIDFITFTTARRQIPALRLLWFDIDFITFTTLGGFCQQLAQLWFDIDFITFTTVDFDITEDEGCGLI